MLALDGGAYGLGLRRFTDGLPERPKGILAVSAHWQAQLPLRITTSEQPDIIHDFGGFPAELYMLDYPAPGDPELVKKASRLLGATGFKPVSDPQRGFDHGVWSVLRHAFPAADVPVVQVTLPLTEPTRLAELGKALAPLRDEGVLILGTGGLIHNLQRVRWDTADDSIEPWALEAEAWFMERIEGRRSDELFRHRELLPFSHAAAPTTEHLDPLFVALGASDERDVLTTVFEGFQMGNLSLRSFAWM
jgi:4,5-DOPA dioxygenase extradiol